MSVNSSNGAVQLQSVLLLPERTSESKSLVLQSSTVSRGKGLIPAIDTKVYVVNVYLSGINRFFCIREYRRGCFLRGQADRYLEAV